MQPSLFSVVDVTDWAVTAEETIGADEKLWLVHPDTAQRWLYKPVTVKDGHVHGEDWVEKASSHLAKLLGVPCAAVELAQREDRRGSISLNLRPDGYEMHTAVVLMAAQVPGYVPGAQAPKGRPGHSLANIRQVLAAALPPPGAELPDGFTAFDVFAGYLLLDAWIANRDRHDENWAVLHSLDGSALRLCGAYDQASGLGFNVPDAKRQELLDGEGVERWVSKGTAWRFEHTGRPATLVELAGTAMDMLAGAAAAHWRSALAGVSDDAVQQVLHRIPGLSDPSRNFALKVLEINRRRLLHQLDERSARVAGRF